MIEAMWMYDHYPYRSAQENAKKKSKDKDKSSGILELQYPPTKSSEKPWWQKDWDHPIRRRDR